MESVARNRGSLELSKQELFPVLNPTAQECKQIPGNHLGKDKAPRQEEPCAQGPRNSEVAQPRLGAELLPCRLDKGTRVHFAPSPANFTGCPGGAHPVFTGVEFVALGRPGPWDVSLRSMALDEGCGLKNENTNIAQICSYEKISLLI